MKRYHLLSSVTDTFRPENTFDVVERRVTSVMHERKDGEYVLYSEVKAEIEALQNRVPEIRIERLEKALGLVSNGCCPECGKHTDNWKPEFGSFAPEAWATYKENGIDGATGHLFTCSRARNKS